MNVSIVLDTSAVLAYASLDGVAVGELIYTVQESGAMVGIPALVLVDAWPELDDAQRAIVTDLYSQDGGPVVVLPLDETAVPPVSALAGQVGHATAHVVASILAHGESTLATYEPGRVKGLVDPYDVLELS
ncbi:hypothetical protein [Hamadaea tsunoensis]|uniref:hypothetical protein n=1 Tax=Hamadaea tsunoensis TaxID=53368 RepID=UPI0003FEC827|nr:hypothetical protein [Hamadaea tsunoensis]